MAVATDELRYTTDHSAPTATSTLYTEPLTFETSTDLRVQVFAQGAAVGGASGAVHVPRSSDAVHDVVARYKELRQGVLSDAQLAARIMTLSTGLAGGAEWNLTTERIGNFQTPTARVAWLDTQWK